MYFISFGLGAQEVMDGITPEHLLGGKGAGLVWLVNEGVPVPPGFVIPATVWAEYDAKPKTTMKAIAKALPAYLAKLEKHFGYMPLLSVRSGARVSCPGMMDTILNVGIDASTSQEWVKRLGPKCFADSFSRLVTMYGGVVHGVRKSEGTLKEVLDGYQAKVGAEFPDAKTQLLNSIEAVFKSWDNDRANIYRKDHGYDRAWGTAVTIQAMVFGNLNEQSGSGVLFTRNPDTGTMAVTGEWLPNAQGEDIVAGIRTPQPLDTMKEWNPAVHDELLNQVMALENLKREMLDIEFTVQDGKLYLLQVRSGKRSATAAVKIALDMKKQGLIDAKTAVKRVSPKQFDLAQMVEIDPKFTKDAAYTGLSACSGVVTGKPVFTKEAAIECKEPCILVAYETTPEDIAGMKAAVGVVTMVGGFTSHAAVVARGMNKPCIVGVGQNIDSFKDVEVLSMDGFSGRIWTEKVPTVGGAVNVDVTEFQALVIETLGIVPVIFDVPTEPMDEALLYLGDKVLTFEKAMFILTKTVNKVNRLYLDLIPTAEEQRYMNIVSAHNPTQRLLDWMDKLLGSKAHKLVVIAKSEYTTSFTRIVPGGDLRALVLSDKEIVLEGVDVNDPAIKRVLDWKKAEGGLQVVSLGALLDGSKSMISMPQALQLLEGV